MSKIAADVGAATLYGTSLKFPDYEGDEGDDISVEGGGSGGDASSRSSSRSSSSSKGKHSKKKKKKSE